MDSIARIHERLNEGRFSARQILIVLVCFMVNFVDGYDVIAIAMAAPVIASDWRISPEFLGYVLSAELLGMTIGAIALAALSDRFGRRTVLVPSVFLVAASTLATVYTQSAAELIVARLATGLGVGGVLTSAATLASEFSPVRVRAAVVTFVTMGFSVGSLLAGLVAAYSLEHLNWQAIFVIGAAMGGVIFVLAMLIVPESMEFIASRVDEPERRLAQLNRTLRKLNLEPLETLPQADRGDAPESGGIKLLMSATFIKPTLYLWIVFFALFWANYGAGKWFPKLLVNDGFDIGAAVYALTIWVMGGVCGSLSSSLLMLRFSVQRIIPALLLISAAILVVYAIIRPDNVADLNLLMFLLGLGISGAMTAMYSVPVTIYPTRLRALGLGCCIGVGRTGAILAPVVTGYLVGAGSDTAQVLLLVTLPSVLIALVMLKFVKFHS